MFEQARLVLYGQVTEERAWGIVLLLLSLASAAPVALVMLNRWVGILQYPIAVLAGGVAFILAGQVWGRVLTWVRARWFT